jgi:hypothetical protein
VIAMIGFCLLMIKVPSQVEHIRAAVKLQ